MPNRTGRHRYGVDINHYLGGDSNRLSTRESSFTTLLQPAYNRRSLPNSRFSTSSMGMFSVRRRPKNGAVAMLDGLDHSTPPPKTPEPSKYTATTETPPSSSKLDVRSPTPVPQCPLPSLASQGTVSLPSIPIRVIRPSTSKISLSARNARNPRLESPQPAPTFDLIDRFPPTPPLPPNWTHKHDHAICVLDACNYSLKATLRKLRSAFPELASAPLTAVMIDKRLRTLDQNPEIEYFRIGLEHIDREDMEKARKGKGPDTTTQGAGYDTRIPADPRVSTLTTQTHDSDLSISSVLAENDGKDRRDGYEISDFVMDTEDSLAKNSVVRSEPFQTGLESYRTGSGIKAATK